MPRVKCSILDRNKEKVFGRIATRGVVKFFNVCNQEQKEIESKITIEAGNSERKRDKILSAIDKGSFLDRLKENNPLDDDDEDQIEQQSTKNDEPTWSVLRDNFIMGSAIKDWDKETNENEEIKSDDEEEQANKTQLKNKFNKQSKNRKKMKKN